VLRGAQSRSQGSAADLESPPLPLQQARATPVFWLEAYSLLKSIKVMLCMREVRPIRHTPFGCCFSPALPPAELVSAPFNQNKGQINLT